MNKLPIVLSIVALLASITMLLMTRSTTDLVYVDINQLVEGYTRTEVERKAFDSKVATLKANVDSLMTNWQAELQAYEKERARMTAKELELKQELLQTKQQQLNNYQQSIQKQIQEEDQKMTQT
ncbi:MAG: OmpH family outer membrane protein, partial [Bacteroidota bacterium]